MTADLGASKQRQLSDHSPGPWSVYDGERHDDVFRKGRTVCAGAGYDQHAVAYCDYLWDDRAEANARLIAAAPDMLDALKSCVASIELNTEAAGPTETEQMALNIAAAAIAKAEGRS